MSKLVFLVMTFFLSWGVHAQEFEIPDDIQLETKDDYERAEALVLKSIEWLQRTPVSREKATRQNIQAFLMKWMTGSPTVTIELVSGLIPTDCPECLMAFLGGWTKYSLENNYSKNKVKSALAGTESTISFYEKNRSDLGRNSLIEKLIRRKKKEKLKDYVQSKMKTQ